MSTSLDTEVLEEWKNELEQEVEQLKTDRDQLYKDSKKVNIKLEFLKRMPDESVSEVYMGALEAEKVEVDKKIEGINWDLRVKRTLIDEIQHRMY